MRRVQVRRVQVLSLKSCRAAATLAVVAWAGAALAWPGAYPARTVVAWGWDISGTGPEELLEHADQIAASGVDGVGVRLWGRTPRGVYKPVLGNPVWNTEDVLPRLDALRRLARTPGLSESLLFFGMCPATRMSFSDDASWKRSADNLRDLARIGAQAGLKGFMLDSEDYPLSSQYTFDPQLDGCDYDAAYVLARKRGAEIFGALFSEHPKAVLLSFWFLTQDETYAAADDPKAAARAKGDLWPAFLNGLLDVLPPQARLVDGNEHTYWSESYRRDYYQKAQLLRDLEGLVEPENRAKYAAQVEMGCAYYLDHYTNLRTKKRRADDPTAKLDVLEHFNRNLHQGARVSRQYLWLYGEKFCQIPWKQSVKYLWGQMRFSEKLSRPDGGTWESQIPGLADMLNAVKNPEAYYNALAADASRELVRNVACQPDVNGGLSAPYSTFKDAKKCPNGTIFVDTTQGDGDSSCFGIRGINGKSGGILLDLPVKPCGIYRVALSAKGAAGTFACRVCWKKNKRYEWRLPQTRPVFSPPDEKTGWSRAVAFVCVPEEADMVTIQATGGDVGSEMVMSGSLAEDKIDVRFDNFSVIRVW